MATDPAAIARAAEPALQLSIDNALKEAQHFINMTADSLDYRASRNRPQPVSAYEVRLEAREQRILTGSGPNAKLDKQKVEAFLAETEATVRTQFAAYIEKLNQLIGPVQGATYDIDPEAPGRWRLFVVTEAGDVQLWETYQTVNWSGRHKLVSTWKTNLSRKKDHKKKAAEIVAVSRGETYTPPKETDPIRLAVNPLKQDAVKRAVEFAQSTVDRVRDILAKHNGNLNEIVPKPDWRTSTRQAVVEADNKRAIYLALTKTVSTEPYIIEMNDMLVERFLKNTAENAASEYDAFVNKLVQKIGKTVAAVLHGSHVWAYSTLTVVREDGSVAAFKTQQIVNYSSLGKVFNQWPTREVATTKSADEVIAQFQANVNNGNQAPQEAAPAVKESPAVAIDTRNYPLEEKYALFNKLYFDNMLDPNMRVVWGVLDGAHGHFEYKRNYVMQGGRPKIDPKTGKKILGPYVFGSGKLVMDKTVVRTEEFLDGILLHEMCHIWVTQVLSNPGAENGGHNDQFLAKIDEIQAKVSFLVPKTEADNEGVTGATELLTVSLVIVSLSVGGQALALVSNREADDWLTAGKDATSDFLRRVFSTKFTGVEKIVLNRVRDPDVSFWYVQTGQRMQTFDTISSIKATDFKYSSSLEPILPSLVDGTRGKILGEYTPVPAAAPAQPTPQTVQNQPTAKPASTQPKSMFPLLYPEEIPSAQEPIPGDGDFTFIFATLKDGMPGFIETDDYDALMEYAPILVLNFRHNYPNSRERASRAKSMARLIELFKALRKRGIQYPCTVSDIQRAVKANAEMKSERVVALASWLTSLNKGTPPVNLTTMNGDNFKEMIATAFRNRVTDDSYATFIQNDLFFDDTPTSPSGLLASIMRGNTNTDESPYAFDMYLWLCQDMSMGSDLVETILSRRTVAFSTIFGVTDLWSKFVAAGRPSVTKKNEAQTYNVSGDGERPTYSNLPKDEVPTLTDEAVEVKNVMGAYTVKYAYLLAGVDKTGAPIFLASDADPSVDENPTTSWYVNIGKFAKNDKEVQNGVDFAATLARLYPYSKPHPYKGSEIRLHVRLAMQSGVFMEDRLAKVVAWIKGINPKVDVDTSTLTMSTLRPWLAKALDDAMGGVNDLDMVAYVAKRARLETPDNKALTTNHIVHRLLMMDPAFDSTKGNLTQVPLLLYLGDTFPEKFYTNAAASYWSDDDFDRIFAMRNLRADFEAEKPKAPIVETPSATDDQNPTAVDNGKPFYPNPRGEPYDRYTLIIQDQPTGSMTGAADVRSYIALLNTQDVAVAEAQRGAVILDRNDPTFATESVFVAQTAMDLDAILRRFSIKLTKQSIYQYLLRAAQESDFNMLSETRVKSLEQWYMQWFGEPFTYNRDLPYTHALLQLSGAIQKAQRDDKAFNLYALKEMRLDDGKSTSVRNPALLANLMRNFGSSSDSLGLWLMDLPVELTNELMSQGKVNFEAIDYVFAQTSVATIWERFDTQQNPAPAAVIWKVEDLIAQGFKVTDIVIEGEQVPTQGRLQKAYVALGVGADDIACYRTAIDRWTVVLKPGVVSPVLNPESTVRPPTVPAPTGTRSNLQVVVDKETRRLVLREEPQDAAQGKNRIGQVNKREARPIASLLNVILAEDFDEIAAMIGEGNKREAAMKMARLAERLRPYFKRTVEEKQPFADLQAWIEENFGKGYTGPKPELHAQKNAMYAFEGVRGAKLTPKQRKYLTNPQTRKEVLQLLGIKLR